MLHFAEVWAYWGSLAGALNDIGGAARFRAGGDIRDGIRDYLGTVDILLVKFFVGDRPFRLDMFSPTETWPLEWRTFRFLGLTLGLWWLLVTVALALRTLMARAGGGQTLMRDWMAVSLIGAAASSCWFVVMVNHSVIGRFGLFRHLFFAFFLAVLFGAVRACRHAAVPAFALRDTAQNHVVRSVSQAGDSQTSAASTR